MFGKRNFVLMNDKSNLKEKIYTLTDKYTSYKKMFVHKAKKPTNTRNCMRHFFDLFKSYHGRLNRYTVEELRCKRGELESG